MSTIEGPAPDTCDSFVEDGFELLDPAGADVLAVGPEADLAPGRDEEQDDVLQQAAEVVSQMAASATTISQEVEGDSATELGGAADAGEPDMALDMLANKAPDCSEEPTQTELCAGSLEKLLKEHAELSRLARQRAEELEALTGRLQGTVRLLLALLAFAGVLAAGSLTGFAYVWSARTDLLLQPATHRAGIHDLHVDRAPAGSIVYAPTWHPVPGSSRPAQQAEEWPSLKYSLAAPHPSESLEQRWLGKNPETLLAYKAHDAADELAAAGRWQRMLWAQGNVSNALMAALRKKDAMIDSMRESAMAKSALIKTLRASASSLRATLREQFRLSAHVGDAMRERDLLIRTLNGSRSSLRIRLRRQHMLGTDLHKMLREQEQWIRVVNSTAVALEAALGANRQFGWALRAKLAASGRVIAALNATVASLRQRVARPADEARARGGTWWPMAIATPATAAPSSTMSGTVHTHKERQDCVSAWRAIASTVLVPSPRVEAASTAVALFVAGGWNGLGAVARRAQSLLRLQLPAPLAQSPGLVIDTKVACTSGPPMRPISVTAPPALNVKSCPAKADRLSGCGLGQFRGHGDALVLAGPPPGSKGLLLLDMGLRVKDAQDRQTARLSDSRTSRSLATGHPLVLSVQARGGWGPTNRTAALPASGGAPAARAPTSFPLLARARLQ